MRRYKRQLLILVIISLFSLPMLSAAQIAAPSATEHLSLTLADLDYKTDETLVGIGVDRVYSISWPEEWKPEPGNSVKLSVSHSPALKPSSSMVVDWNGTRLGSMLLTADNANRGTLEVEIPANLIVPGYNALRVRFYMGIHDDICEDYDNPAVWATVHSDTSLELSYSKLAAVLDLSKFPAPLVSNNGVLLPNVVTFVLPDQPTEAELNAVAIISASLGKSASWRPLTLDVISGSVQKTAGRDLVYVARADRLAALQVGNLPILFEISNKFRLTDQQGIVIPDEAGLLWEQASPADSSSVMLVVTGQTDAGLLKAASALGSPSTYSRLSGQLGIILDVPQPEISDSPVGQILTLRDLGYDDVSARGVRDQTLNFNIPLPLAWQITSEIPFDIHFAHSTLLHEKQSAMNILLNGSPVSNISLTKDNSEDAWTTVRLPARLFQIGDNQLTIQSTLKLIDGYVDNTQCGQVYRDEAWVSVFSDSRLHMPAVPAGSNITLWDYPYVFMGDPSLAQLALVVPDNLDLVIAKSIALITGRLGRFASSTVRPAVQTAPKALASSPAYPYQIVIGLPSANAAIRAINDSLPLPFQINNNQLKPNPKVPEVISAHRGYVQSLQTQEGQPRLVVSGSDNEGLLWAATAISEPELMTRLRQEAAIIDGPESIVNFQIRKPVKEVAVPPGTAVGAELPPQPVVWVQWLTGGFLALAFLILVILWIIELIRRQQVRKGYETL